MAWGPPLATLRRGFRVKVALASALWSVAPVPLLFGGCGSGSAGGGWGADAGSTADNSVGTVIVAMTWSYFNPVTCFKPPACNPPEMTCTPGPSDNCSCQNCSSPPCMSIQLVVNCCAQSATIDESSVGQLVADYPACQLRQ